MGDQTSSPLPAPPAAQVFPILPVRAPALNATRLGRVEVLPFEAAQRVGSRGLGQARGGQRGSFLLFWYICIFAYSTVWGLGWMVSCVGLETLSVILGWHISDGCAYEARACEGWGRSLPRIGAAACGQNFGFFAFLRAGHLNTRFGLCLTEGTGAEVFGWRILRFRHIYAAGDLQMEKNVRLVNPRWFKHVETKA